MILIINGITITAFARIRHLRKRSTYLITTTTTLFTLITLVHINLTVADLLVGAVTGPLIIYQDKESNGFTWPGFVFLAIERIFPVASQVNLSLISLERLHATLFPFRHYLITKSLYLKIIFGSWFVILLIAFVMPILPEVAFRYSWASSSVVTLLILAVCYVIIIVNVQRSPLSDHRGLIHTERKLSITLLLVTGISVLTILPYAVYISMPAHIQQGLSNALGIKIHVVVAVIYLASSIVNPLVYAIRMQEFRKAIGNLVSKITEPTRGNPSLPHAMS